MRFGPALLVLVLVVVAGSALASQHDQQRVNRPTSSVSTPASNVGFRVEVDFDPVAGEGGPSLLSLPVFVGLADTADASADAPCDARTGDGVEDALDLACSLWTSREGGLWIYRRAAAGWQGRGVWRNADGTQSTAGDWLDPVTTGEGIVVVPLAPTGGAAHDRGVILGSHDPSNPCPLIAPSPPLPFEGVLNLWYHSMFAKGDELLCGLAGVDWMDADGDGFPDTCRGQLFDPTVAGTACVADVQDGASSLLCVTADPSAPHGLRFDGASFDLAPPHAAAVFVSPEQPGAAWCQPHF